MKNLYSLFSKHLGLRKEKTPNSRLSAQKMLEQVVKMSGRIRHSFCMKTLLLTLSCCGLFFAAAGQGRGFLKEPLSGRCPDLVIQGKVVPDYALCDDVCLDKSRPRGCPQEEATESEEEFTEFDDEELAESESEAIESEGEEATES